MEQAESEFGRLGRPNSGALVVILGLVLFWGTVGWVVWRLI
jgi:hypothetical protein